MSDRPESDKIDRLTIRVEQAQADALAGTKSPAASSQDAELVSASRLGFELVGSVTGAGFLGWLIDYAFGTMPWFLVSMIVIGFAVGVMRVFRALQSADTQKTKGS